MKQNYLRCIIMIVLTIVFILLFLILSTIINSVSAMPLYQKETSVYSTPYVTPPNKITATPSPTPITDYSVYIYSVFLPIIKNDLIQYSKSTY